MSNIDMRNRNGSGSKIITLQNKQPTKTKPSGSSLSINGLVVVGLLLVLGTLFAGMLIYKLYDIQINHHEEYALMGSSMHWNRIKDVPLRGDILDSKGNVLAGTTYEYNIGVTPKDVKSLKDKSITTEMIAQEIASIFSLEYTEVLDNLNQKDSIYVQIAKKRPRNEIDILKTYLEENQIGGVRIDPVPKRYYVHDSFASQVIGFADQNDNTLIGQYGIEAYYNDILTGTEGYTYAETDRNQGALPYSPPTTIEKQDGLNVVLNIDPTIQAIATDACREAYEAYHPKEGVGVIVMNPYTGSVYAMVSLPDYNLNEPRSIPYAMDEETWALMSDEEKTNYLMSSVWRNRTISDTYEPGSTFKVLTTAIALEEGLTFEEEMFSDEPIEVSSLHTISCWRQKHGGNHGTETLKQAFENSCNPVFVQLAMRIGINKYYQYVRNFGFYDVTGIDLPAEGLGLFHSEPSSVDLATLSFGESSTVTPIQLANVFCALVNGGTLMKPQVVKALTDRNGDIIHEFAPVAIKTVFSENTANRVKEMMKSVVAEGTGSAGYVEGYTVAGKTSTSTIDIGEDQGMHVLSFGCYAPFDNPQIVVLVIINKPLDKELGSSAAARVAAQIISPTLEYLGVPRELTDEDYEKITIKYAIPELKGKTVAEAKQILYTNHFEVILGEEGMTDKSIVMSVYPDPSVSILYRNGSVVLYSSEIVEEAMMRQVSVPDFVGKSLTDCISIAQFAGVNIDIVGNPKGVVVSQDPQYGFVDSATPSDDGMNTESNVEDGESVFEEEGSDVSTVTPVPTSTADQNNQEDDGEADADSVISTPEPTVDLGEKQRIKVPCGAIIKLTME
ncbi:MAG: hypothetical protein GXY06_06910 [Clostridiaceae bacterium]|nr:hypothetical protein [Clostridiaceae bacterium]